MEDLPNKMRDVLGVLADVDLIEEAGHDLVRITVAPYPYPVSYKGEYHVRIGSTKQMLKGPELNRFLISKTGKRWDSVPVPDVNVSQLKKKRIRWFRRKAGELDRLPKIAKREDDEVLIEKLRLKEGDLLRRAALLLFHDAPDDFFTGALIKIAYFKSDSDLRFQDVIQGDLFTQIDQAMDLLTTKYLQAAFSIEGTRHTERLPIPEEALREAVINAVAHKDYGSGNPIQISVYDDKLMIWNSGQLSKDWTIERLYGKHPSIPFNPDVANQMFRAGNIEAWGTGIDRMVSACDRHGCPPPIPVISGSTTDITICIATIASTALPPSFNIE